MRRHGDLFERVVALENMWHAWRDFRRGKRHRPTVRAFELDADRSVARLARSLAEGSYRPGAYRLKLLRDPKTRLIAAAPVRDRVVHHAVHRLVAPVLDRSLVDATYACLPGRGTHRALIAFLAALRRYDHVILLDIRHYFMSIDRAILLQLLARKLRERRLLNLLKVIADGGAGLYQRPGVAEAVGLPSGFPPPGCGLPIGNLTSQWWANHYMSGLDHYVKRALRLPHAQRYMDDIALFANDPARLERAREQVKRWLHTERRLVLKKPDAPVRSTADHFVYLGHRVTRSGIEPGPRILRRMKIRLHEILLTGDVAKLERSLASYRGIAGLSGLLRLDGAIDNK